MNSSEKNFLQKTADFLLLATVLIAPLKLGGMLLPGVPCMLPENILEAIFHTAPPMIFVLLAALLLILQLLAYSVPENFTPKNPLCKLSLLWSFLPLAALIGFIDADSLESCPKHLCLLVSLCFCLLIAHPLHPSPLGWGLTSCFDFSKLLRLPREPPQALHPPPQPLHPSPSPPTSP